MAIGKRAMGAALLALTVGGGLLAGAGCNYRTETVPRVPAPAAGRDTERTNYEPNKPLPPEGGPALREAPMRPAGGDPVER